MTEQLGLDQRLRQRRTVQHHERLVLAARKPLDRARHEFLTRTARTAHQNRRLARSDLTDLLVDRTHLAAVADQMARVVRKHVTELAVLLDKRIMLGALLTANRRRIGRDVRNDTQKRHVLHQRRRLPLHLAVNRKRADDLPKMHQRNTDERKRLVLGSRTRPVEEALVLADVRHDFGSARLRHNTRNALTQLITSMSTLFRIQRLRRGLDSQLIPLQKHKCTAQHPHAPLENLQNPLQKPTNIAFTDDNRGDFP